MGSTSRVRIETSSRCEMRDITGFVREAVVVSGVKDGLCLVYVPHTTAAVAINENADPDVATDIVSALGRIVPDRDGYRHAEGNSQAHIKASVIGNSRIILVEAGKAVLGTWEGVYICEFDGPRTRNVLIKVIEG